MSAAEQAIAGLLAEHEFDMYGCACGYDSEQDEGWIDNHRAHVASVIAAHIGAPDELTARPECRRAFCAYFDDWQKAGAERDALRKGIREALNDPHHIQQRLIDLLGDA